MSSSSVTDQPQSSAMESLQLDIQTLVRKISEIEIEQEEHKMVIETLRPMDPSRASYRLINGILVEKTVAEVLPVLESQLTNISILISTLKEQLNKKQEEFAVISK